MNLTPVIWTSVGEQTFDTQDWRLGDPASHVTEQDVMANFQTFLDLSQTLSTGFIVLAHDLYTQSVNLASTSRPSSARLSLHVLTALLLAAQHILPGAMAFRPRLTLEPINTCQGKAMSEAYVETSTGAGANSSSSSASSAASSSSSATGTNTRTTPSSSASSGSGSAAEAGASSSQTAVPASGGEALKVSAGLMGVLMAGVWLF